MIIQVMLMHVGDIEHDMLSMMQKLYDVPSKDVSVWDW